MAHARPPFLPSRHPHAYHYNRHPVHAPAIPHDLYPPYTYHSRAFRRHDQSSAPRDGLALLSRTRPTPELRYCSTSHTFLLDHLLRTDTLCDCHKAAAHRRRHDYDPFARGARALTRVVNYPFPRRFRFRSSLSLLASSRTQCSCSPLSFRNTSALYMVAYQRGSGSGRRGEQRSWGTDFVSLHVRLGRVT